jgi:hypothetical protein
VTLSTSWWPADPVSPTQWLVTDGLSLTGSGNMQKPVLREQLAAHALRPLAASEEVR